MRTGENAYSTDIEELTDLDFPKTDSRFVEAMIIKDARINTAGYIAFWVIVFGIMMAIPFLFFVFWFFPACCKCYDVGNPQGCRRC